MRQLRTRSLQAVFILGGLAFPQESLAQRHLFSEIRPPEVLEPRQLEFFGSGSIYQTKDGEDYSGWYYKRAFLGLGVGISRFSEINLQAGSHDLSDSQTDSNSKTFIFGLRRNIIMVREYALTIGLEYEFWKDQAGDSLNFETAFSLRANSWANIYASGVLDFEQDRRAESHLNLGLAAISVRWLKFGLEAALDNQFDGWRPKDYESKAGINFMFVLGPVSLTFGAYTNPNPTRGIFFEALGTMAIRL